MLGLAHVLARRRPQHGSLRRQFTVGVAVAVGQLVVLAAAAAQLMFVSTHDALMLMVVVVFAGAVAVRAAQLFATQRDPRRRGAARHAGGGGGRSSRVPPPWPTSADELAELGRAVNTAIAKLDHAEEARGDLIAAVSGLGLAISRAIVEAHGGRIWLADSASGTRVRFSLPRS